MKPLSVQVGNIQRVGAGRRGRFAALVLAPLAVFVISCGSDRGREAAPSTATPVATSSATVAATATATATVPASTPTPTIAPTTTPTAEPTELSPSADPTAPAEVAPAEDLLLLQQQMAQAIDAYWVPGDYAVAITDLQTGETVSVHGDQPQLAGCVPNLFVLFQVARDIEAGRYGLEAVDSLVSATTWSSNATTAWQLYGIVGDGDVVAGVSRVNVLVHDVLGLDAVVLDHPPGFDDSIGIDPNNWITAVAANQALAALWRGDVVGASGREYLLDRLNAVKPGLNYLTAAVPEGIVSHKNGFLPADTGYVDNDAGIIRLVRGDTEYAYAMTFLSQEIATKYADIPLGQQLASLAYQVIAARYP